MKRVCIIGHFGHGETLLNGQTVKTKIVTKEIVKELGKKEVSCIDTHGGFSALKNVMKQSINALKYHKNVIIMPAENGLRIFAPILLILNVIFHRKLHYVVIGGWLPQFLKKRKCLSFFLKKFDYIYVEANDMKVQLEKKGFNNVFVVPNCKELVILKNEDLLYDETEPYKLCTFSRVMKEKGIEDLIAVSKLLPSNYTLDIYGEIKEDKYRNINFNESGITYHGVVSSEQVLKTLVEYDLLLLPSYREGYPGIIIEAMSVGIPCVSTYAGGIPEIVEDGYNGRLVIPGDVDAIKQAILSINATNYSQYSGNALKKFEEEFESDKTNKRILEIIMH